MDAVDSDDALLAASREGGREAFAKLVERYRDLVCALTFSATGNRALSEDLAQETFLAAWRGLPTLRDPGSFRGWLCTIARNLGRNARRDGSRELPTDPLPEHADELGLCDVLSEAEEAALVWRALSEMQDSYREPLVLFYREGKSAAEVARALGLSVDAAEQRLSRGRRQLKAGVSSLVERALVRSRPGAGFVAAVVAAIGSETLLPTTVLAATEAAAGTTRSAASWGATAMAIAWKTMVVGAAVTAITYGCMAWNEREEPDSRSAASVTAASDEADADPVALVQPSAKAQASAVGDASTRLAREQAQRSGVELGLPRYQLTVPSPRLAAVNLAGGASEVTNGDPPGMTEDSEPTVRTITGRVLGSDGEPVEGAVVLAGTRLSVYFRDNLTGQFGDTTAADGSFSLPITHAKRIVVLALHPSGWSALGFVAEGSGGAQLELRLAAPARIEGTLVLDGVGAQPELHLQDEGRGLAMRIIGTPDGQFGPEPLPPGRYSASVGVADDGPGDAASEKDVRKEFEIVAGKTETWNASLASGTTVVVLPKLSANVDYKTITYAKLVGRHTPSTFAEVRALRKDDLASWNSFGGDDLDDVMEFRDVDPGLLTFCVELEDPGPRPPKGTPRVVAELGFGCTTVEVDGKLDVQEVEVVVDPPAEAR